MEKDTEQQKHLVETKQSKEPNSDMRHLLEKSDRKFKITMMNMVKALVKR